MRNTLVYSLLVASFALLTGCKLTVMMTSGGDADSLSGTRDCAGPNICEFDVTSSDFTETFTAIAHPGYEFVKWSDGAGFFCAGSTNPICTVSLPPEPWASAIVALFDIGYLMPIFKDIGLDPDGDGIRNELDPDDDGDGLPDSEDPCPLDPNLACGVNDVGGMILEDTLWTAENGPIRVVANVEVAEGVTLTIGPGVELLMDFSSISVWGNLVIHGTESEPVTASNGVIVAAYDDAATIDIRFLHVQSQSHGWGGAIFPGKGSFVLRDSILDGIQTIDLRYNNADAYIERNIFRGSARSNARLDINHTASSGTVYVRNNLFEPHADDHNVDVIYYNNYQTSSTLVLRLNSFLTGDRNVISANQEPLDISDNYWGTTDTSVIDERIRDRNDSLAYPTYVNYLPILSTPDEATPTGL